MSREFTVAIDEVFRTHMNVVNPKKSHEVTLHDLNLKGNFE